MHHDRGGGELLLTAENSGNNRTNKTEEKEGKNQGEGGRRKDGGKKERSRVGPLRRLQEGKERPREVHHKDKEKKQRGKKRLRSTRVTE